MHNVYRYARCYSETITALLVDTKHTFIEDDTTALLKHSQ
jgi:hypothetical protein